MVAAAVEEEAEESEALEVEEVEEVDLGKAATNAEGCVVLTDERFADTMKGFALVHVINGHASHQRIVTNCTYYERFTTEEALQAAAKSYRGLTR